MAKDVTDKSDPIRKVAPTGAGGGKKSQLRKADGIVSKGHSKGKLV